MLLLFASAHLGGNRPRFAQLAVLAPSASVAGRGFRSSLSASGDSIRYALASLGYLLALAQHDLRRLIAYGSVAQMGFCLIGLGALTPQGVAGSRSRHRR